MSVQDKVKVNELGVLGETEGPQTPRRPAKLGSAAFAGGTLAALAVLLSGALDPKSAPRPQASPKPEPELDEEVDLSAWFEQAYKQVPGDAESISWVDETGPKVMYLHSRYAGVDVGGHRFGVHYTISHIWMDSKGGMCRADIGHFHAGLTNRQELLINTYMREGHKNIAWKFLDPWDPEFSVFMSRNCLDTSQGTELQQAAMKLVCKRLTRQGRWAASRLSGMAARRTPSGYLIERKDDRRGLLLPNTLTEAQVVKIIDESSLWRGKMASATLSHWVKGEFLNYQGIRLDLVDERTGFPPDTYYFYETKDGVIQGLHVRHKDQALYIPMIVQYKGLDLEWDFGGGDFVTDEYDRVIDEIETRIDRLLRVSLRPDEPSPIGLPDRYDIAKQVYQDMDANFHDQEKYREYRSTYLQGAES